MDSLRKIRGLLTGSSRDRRRNDTPYTRPETQSASTGSTLFSFLVPRIFLHDEPATSREETLPQHIRKERERVYKNLEEEQKSRRVRRQKERSTRSIVEQDRSKDSSDDLLKQVASVPPAPVLSSNIFTQITQEETSTEAVQVEAHDTFQTPRAFDMNSGFKYHGFEGTMSPAETVSKFLHAKGNSQMEAEELEGCVSLLKTELHEEQEKIGGAKSKEITRTTMKRPFAPSTQVSKFTSTVPRTALFSSRKKKTPLYFGPGFGRHSTPYNKIIKPPVYSSPPSAKRARVETHGSQRESNNLHFTAREKLSHSLRNSTPARSTGQSQTPGKNAGTEEVKTQKGSATARRIMDIIGEMDPQPVAPAAKDIINPYELTSPISRRKVESKPKPEIVAKTITTSAKSVPKKLTPMELLEKSMPKELREEAPPVVSISSMIAVTESKDTPDVTESSSSQPVNIQLEPKVPTKRLEDAFRSVEPSMDNSLTHLEQSPTTEQKSNQVEPPTGSIYTFSLVPAFEVSNSVMQEVSMIPESELPTYEFGEEKSKVRSRVDASAATSLLDSAISTMKAPSFLKSGKESTEKLTSISTLSTKFVPTTLTQESCEVKFDFTLEAAYDQQNPLLKEVVGCPVSDLPSYEFQLLSETN